MNEFKYVIKDVNGIHARPAGMIAKKAQEYECEITLECRNKSVNAKKLLALMGMGIKKGDTVTVRASDNTDISGLKCIFESLL